MDNGKPNSDRFLSLLAERLLRTGAVRQGVERKPNIGRLAPDTVLAGLVEGCDLVVTGVGDCAGCCSCSTHDAITLARQGLPSVMVATTEFLTTARIAATAAGVPDYPVVEIDHPLGSLGDEALARRADAAMRQILDRTTGSR